MTKRKRKPYDPSKPRTAIRKLTEAQLETMIHAGPVTKELRQHEEIVTQVIERDASGWPLNVRQMVSTPVHRLLEQEAIDFAGIFGATMLRWDHDIALYSRLSSNWEMRVDGGGGAGPEIEKRMFHAQRLRRAFEHLGHELGRIAWVSVIERPMGDLEATHTSVGQSLLPKGTNVEQRGAGKGSLVLVVRELSRFYKLTNAPDLPHVQQLSALDYMLQKKNLQKSKKSA